MATYARELLGKGMWSATQHAEAEALPRAGATRRAALALSVLLPLAVAGTAHADSVLSREQSVVLAHPEVRGLIRTGDYRVVTGVNPAGVTWLVVEKLENGAPAWQFWVQSALWGSWTVSVGHDLSDIRLISYRGGIVAFAARHQNRDWLNCKIDTRGSQWGAACTGNYTGPQPQPQPQPPPQQQQQQQPQPQPQPPSWSADPQVIGACERTFMSPAFEQTCLQAVAYYRYNPASLIEACDRATTSDAQGLECVRSAGAASADPSSVVVACDQATISDAAVSQCTAAALRLPGNAPAAVLACDQATISDAAVTSCLTAAVGLVGDPLATIGQCDRSTIGDANKVACIQRAPHTP